MKKGQAVVNTNGTKATVAGTTRDGGVHITGADGKTRWFSAGQAKQFLKKR